MQAARRASLTPSDPTEPTVPTAAVGRTGGAISPRARLLSLFAAVAGLGYLTDLGTKELALATLEAGETVPVVGRWFGFFLTFNSGAAFSIGTSYTIVLTGIAVVAAVVTLTVVALRLRSTGWAWGLGFLLAGILGNLTDRLFRAPEPLRGHVVDFLRLPNFPVFNVADICITVAAGFIIVQTVRGVRVDGSREQRDGAAGSGPQAPAP